MLHGVGGVNYSREHTRGSGQINWLMARINAMDIVGKNHRRVAIRNRGIQRRV